MFAALSFLVFPTAYFMQCVVISYMFWLYCMMPAIRIVGLRAASTPLNTDVSPKSAAERELALRWPSRNNIAS